MIECDGNNLEDLLSTLDEAKSRHRERQAGNEPYDDCHGERSVDFMEGTHKWHGAAPSDEQLATALGQLEETLGDY